MGAGVQVYEGMIIGEHAHPSDLNVNACRGRKLTNIRAANRDENVILSPPREMGLEKALEWIAPDELVEVTPKSVRLRKRVLSSNDRYKLERDRKREGPRGGGRGGRDRLSRPGRPVRTCTSPAGRC